MGYEHQNDDDQFTKPKNRIIAEAYAKGMDEMISISLGDSHVDPAGLNFDMNHLDSIASDAMGATLTNYLSNIIHRRNAMTTQSRIDFNDPNYMAATTATAAAASVSHQQHSSTGGVDNNNSEISVVSVRHFSVESRRNSMDSQVSQVSVKMSEIKARLETRKQKNRSKNAVVKAKKRSRNQNVCARHSRYSNRSNQINRYKHPVDDVDVDDDSMGDNFIEMNSTNLIPSTSLLPIERFSARTTADINDLNQFLHHQNHRDANLLTLDDDEMHVPNEPIPIDYHLSTDSVDAMDDVQAASVDRMFRTFLQTNTGNHIEMFNPTMSGLNGYKKFRDGNGMANGKCQKYTQMTNGDGMELPIPSSQPAFSSNSPRSFPNGYADRSIHKHLPQHDDCKQSSCDIGIQANDYEIVRYNSHDKKIHNHVQSMMIDNNISSNETHQLLPNRKPQPAPQRKDNLSGKHLSESEKIEQLKRLLLPSN